MTRLLTLAALALACVLSISPVFAMGVMPGQLGPAPGFLIMIAFAAALLVVGVLLRRTRQARWSALSAMVVGVLVLTGSAAFAQDAVAPIAPGTIILPYGEWIVAAANTAASVLIPALVAFLIKAVTSVYPWAALFLTQRRVEQMANAVTEYAINAVPGAVKEGKLSVNLGMEVIARAVQYAVDAAPKKALEAAGGEAGLARIVFRKLNLEDGANEANTLAPALAALPVK